MDEGKKREELIVVEDGELVLMTNRKTTKNPRRKRTRNNYGKPRRGEV